MDEEYLYVGYKQCGCPNTIIHDCGDEWTAGEVAECIKRGERVERVSLPEYRCSIINAFLKKCEHEAAQAVSRG